MEATLAIHDLYIRPLSSVREDQSVHWIALRDRDHLLRRFGQAEVVRAAPGATGPLRLREVADEVWTLIEGQVEFVWHDLRPGSPTHRQWHRLVCREPTVVLVPFGVAFGYRALREPALLLKLATHADGEHAGDRTLVWDEAHEAEA